MQLRVGALGAARQGPRQTRLDCWTDEQACQGQDGLRSQDPQESTGSGAAPGRGLCLAPVVAAKLASRASLPSLLLPAANLSSLLCGTARHRGRALAGDNARSL